MNKTLDQLELAGHDALRVWHWTHRCRQIYGTFYVKTPTDQAISHGVICMGCHPNRYREE